MREVSWCIALLALLVTTLADSAEDLSRNDSSDTASTSTGSSQEEVEEHKAYMRTPSVGGVAVRAGEDALLTCVVLGGRGRPVLWRRAKDLQLLTAGGVRVTRDDRVTVLHDDSEEPLPGPGIAKGGDVWALVIKSVKTTDAGLYVCELNTEPPVRSFHRLTELLPSAPKEVEVEPLNEKQLNVYWSPPMENSDTVIEYVVNVTTLRSFDAHLIDPSESSMKANESSRSGMSTTYKVPSNRSFIVLNDLLPFTMYEIHVTSFNIHGSSLPSYGVRSLTLTPGKMKSTAVAAAPKLPDVRACCVNGGVNHLGCVEKLCDPTKTFDIALQVTDLMICAPWDGVTFGCLANGMDHTPCCRTRGLPESCLTLCSGNITSLDFNHFNTPVVLTNKIIVVVPGRYFLARPRLIRSDSETMSCWGWRKPPTDGYYHSSKSVPNNQNAAITNDF